MLDFTPQVEPIYCTHQYFVIHFVSLGFQLYFLLDWNFDFPSNNIPDAFWKKIH